MRSNIVRIFSDLQVAVGKATEAIREFKTVMRSIRRQDLVRKRRRRKYRRFHARTGG